MPSNHIILCPPLLHPPSVFPSIRVFSNESVLCIRWPKYWNLGLSISPSNEYSGLISFRIDWLDLLAVQGTLKSLLKYHSSKASIFRCFQCFQFFPASKSLQITQLFPSGGQSIGVSASTSVLPMNIQDWFPLDELVGSPCSPRDSQESSPTPQFKSINYSALSLHYSPTLTSIHDYWNIYSFD